MIGARTRAPRANPPPYSAGIPYKHLFVSELFYFQPTSLHVAHVFGTKHFHEDPEETPGSWL